MGEAVSGPTDIERTPLRDFPRARTYPEILGRDGLGQARTSPDSVFRVRSCKGASRLACSAQARTRSPRPRTRRALTRPDGPASIFESGLFGDARNMSSESGRFAGLENRSEKASYCSSERWGRAVAMAAAHRNRALDCYCLTSTPDVWMLLQDPDLPPLTTAKSNRMST